MTTRNTILKYKLFSLTIWVLLFLFSCKKDNVPFDNSEIPNVPVNITVNTSLPLYADLQIPGRWMYLNGGVRGIILVHWYDGTFYALERNCPYRAMDSCSTVTVEDNNVFARCGSMADTTYIPCCNSRFQLETGLVNRGPATFSLRNYRVSVSGSLIFINN